MILRFCTEEGVQTAVVLGDFFKRLLRDEVHPVVCEKLPALLVEEHFHSTRFECGDAADHDVIFRTVHDHPDGLFTKTAE